jgi:hypothetical protein
MSVYSSLCQYIACKHKTAELICRTLYLGIGSCKTWTLSIVVFITDLKMTGKMHFKLEYSHFLNVFHVVLYISLASLMIHMCYPTQAETLGSWRIDQQLMHLKFKEV